MKSGALYKLVSSWDELSGNIARLVDAETAIGVKKGWTDFLLMVVGRHCAICGRSSQSKAREFPVRFAISHWPKEKGYTDKINSMSVWGLLVRSSLLNAIEKQPVRDGKDTVDVTRYSEEAGHAMDLDE